MRKKLGTYDGQRITVTARFERFGVKTGYTGRQVRTILLRKIRRGDEYIANHLWFTCGKTFDRLILREGDQIQFDAKVVPYVKGYLGRREYVFSKIELDFKLERPTKAFKILKDVAA